jgi:hypothetical protein
MLKETQERAVALRFDGKTALEISDTLAVSLRTVKRWLKLPEFVARLSALTSDVRAGERVGLIYSRAEARRDWRWLRDVARGEIEQMGLKYAAAQAFVNAVNGLSALDSVKADGEEELDVIIEAINHSTDRAADAALNNQTGGGLERLSDE